MNQNVLNAETLRKSLLVAIKISNKFSHANRESSDTFYPVRKALRLIIAFENWKTNFDSFPCTQNTDIYSFFLNVANIPLYEKLLNEKRVKKKHFLIKNGKGVE